jgi:hypothetical protein
MIETIITALLPIAIKLITAWITGSAEKNEKHKKALKKWLAFVESIDYGTSTRLKREADSARRRLRDKIKNSKVLK